MTTAHKNWIRNFATLTTVCLCFLLAEEADGQKNSFTPESSNLRTEPTFEFQLVPQSNAQNVEFGKININNLNSQNNFEFVDQSLISDFWIGVQCEKAKATVVSIEEAQGAELTISGGMTILSVTEDGAAEEAGIQKGDVLLKFSGKDINELSDLYKAIGETEDNEAELIVVREGKLKKLEIKPKRRPKKKEAAENGTAQERYLWTTIEDAYLAELQGNRLPKGYDLSVNLSQGKKVEIEVSQGESSWTADESSIDELPDEVKQVAVNLVLSCKPMVETQRKTRLTLLPSIQNQVQQQWLNRSPASSPLFWNPVSNDDNVESSSQKLESIQKQLSELTEIVEQLKSKQDKN